MIDRYCTEKMSEIWSRKAKYDRWLEVELAICEAHAEFGTFPKEDLYVIQRKATYSLERCDELEKKTHHDLMAFVQNLTENAGTQGRFIHFGVTSYDVIDTALGMMLRDSGNILIQSAENLLLELEKLAQKHVNQPMIGRTHGVHAEPITFGHKVANWYQELFRNTTRLKAATDEVAVGKISGAVGIHAFVSPEQEKYVCEKLGLKPDPISTQIINRDRHANFLNVLALLGAGLERIATELRNLQRTEILEVQEVFHKNQTGSSAMPHKRNPWRSETVAGLARILRANAHAMLESVCTWHERDLTNSSVERIIFPDSCQLADFMLNRILMLIQNLEVLPKNMKKNLDYMGDLIFSEHLMLALISTGLSRNEAYKLSQSLAAKAWKGEDFKELVKNDPLIKNLLSKKELKEIFSLEHHLRHSQKFQKHMKK